MRLLSLPLAAAALALLACSPPQSPPPAPAPAPQSDVTVVVASPQPGARVTSPLRVEGTAPGDWYFEAQFPAQLRGANGELLAEAPALAQSEWMTEAPVPYVAELQFSVAQETQATLVLQEDMPGDEANPREVVISVVLLPAQ